MCICSTPHHFHSFKQTKKLLLLRYPEICLAGGVSANRGLRTAFEKLGNESGWNIYIPAFEYYDNAAMIAITGYYKFLAGETSDDLSITATARAEW